MDREQDAREEGSPSPENEEEEEESEASKGTDTCNDDIAQMEKILEESRKSPARPVKSP